MAAGSIVVDLLMRTGSFTTDTARASKQLKQFQKDVVSTASSIKGQLVGALAAAGIAVDESLVLPAAFTEEGARLAVETLQSRVSSFDAVFACSDLLAMTAINLFRQAGLRVPEDVAVVGYDDIALARYFHPPLSTVQQPIAAAGEALVQAVLRLAEFETTAPQLLATELIVRQSS